jgi:hypothetical protein
MASGRWIIDFLHFGHGLLREIQQPFRGVETYLEVSSCVTEALSDTVMRLNHFHDVPLWPLDHDRNSS